MTKILSSQDEMKIGDIIKDFRTGKSTLRTLGDVLEEYNLKNRYEYVTDDELMEFTLPE